MNTLTTATGLRKFGHAIAAALTTADDLRREACLSQAAECQAIAGRCSDLLRSQYEELARQWLLVADLAQLQHSVGDIRYH
jgi:hypothetical protein